VIVFDIKKNLQLQKISISASRNIQEIPRGSGVSKAKIYRGEYEAKLQFPGVGSSN